MTTPITAVVGAGIMGAKMIERLLKAGHDVRVFDPDERAAAAAAELGSSVRESEASAAGAADVCILSLPDPQTVTLVMDRILSGENLPRVVVDTSTVDPTTTRVAAEAAVGRGVGYLDGPVLGRPDRCGQWTLPIGGSAQVLESARPTLEVLARQLVHVGPSGTGNVVKLLNNLMFAAINAVTAECLAGAERVGLEPAVFVDTVAGSGAASVSNLFREIGPKIVTSDFSPAFTLELLHKDVALAVGMLEDAGLATTVGPVLLNLSERGLAAGLGGQDTSALVQVLRADGADGEEGS